MCILAHRVAAAQTTPPTPPAQALTPLQRQQLAREALAGQSISGLAHQHQVSRKFVYQQRAPPPTRLSATPSLPSRRDRNRCCFTCP